MFDYESRKQDKPFRQVSHSCGHTELLCYHPCPELDGKYTYKYNGIRRTIDTGDVYLKPECVFNEMVRHF